MQVVYANQPFPEEWTSCLFLAGPTPREADVPSWRPKALQILKDIGYDGVVFVPESTEWKHSYQDQVEWERKGLNFADIILFWIPRDLEKLPGFTTNVEFGTWLPSAKVVLGHPRQAPKNRYLDWLLKITSGGHETPSYTLEDTINTALSKIREGAHRSKGERYVPLHVWKTPQFQSWYENLTRIGNRLDEAELRWVFKMPRLQQVFSWVLWVKVWIKDEDRYKENEWVLARTDLSAVLLWHLPQETPWDSILHTEIVLIREFRSPGRTPDGFIHELPGGSSMKPNQDPLLTASEEVHEETGLIVPVQRFKALGHRQVAGTLSSHHAHLFSAELTREEMAQAKELAKANTVHGLEEDSEQTYVEIMTFKEILQSQLVDWTTIGMISQTLLGK